MGWCSGRNKEISLCNYVDKCTGKMDCTTFEDTKTGKCPTYCAGIGKFKCIRDDGKEMTREELNAEIEKYRSEAIRQTQDKCILEFQIKEMQCHIDCLKAELSEVQMNKQEPAGESFEIKIDALEIPIQKASVLIRDTQDKYQEVYGTNDGFSMAISDLKQIAKHLLVYCNHAEV